MKVTWVIGVIALLLFALTAFGQYKPVESSDSSNVFSYGNIIFGGGGRTIVDSTTWHLAEVEQEGNLKCKHDWVSSGEYYPKPFISCAVIHGCGSVCGYHWPQKDLICKKCGRMEHWKSVVHAHCYNPKSSYEKEVEKWQPKLKISPDSIYRIFKTDSIWSLIDTLRIDTSSWIKNPILPPDTIIKIRKTPAYSPYY